jgi:Skp family chaperone for outer membrane proteins
VVAARDAGGPYKPPANRGGAARNGAAAEHPEANVPHGGAAVHPNDLPNERPAAPNTGNAKLDKKYQKQQDKLIANQNKERQKLQQKQDQEHQRVTNDAQKQQMEQKHQQQTQQLQQKHVQQQQQMQARQQPRAEPKK